MISSKAIVFAKPHGVELRNVPLPVPGPWDLTVELETSAISLGTERWALEGKRPEGDVTYPCIPGYLSIGRITGCGEESAKTYSIGEKINFLAARIPEGYGGNWMCGHLSPAVVAVNPAEMGGFAGMPYVEKLPAGISSAEASLAGLAAVACRGIDMAEIRPDDRVVVVGQGVIGHAAAQICRLKGARVLTADTLDSRVALSARLAADVAINSRTEDLALRVADFTSGRGADVVIDTSGSVAMIQQEVELLKLFGKLIFQGWYPPPSSLDLHRFQLRFTQAFFPCGHSGEAVSRCMRWMAAGQLRLGELISHTFTPEEAPHAYDLVLHHPQETMAIVFDWSVQ